MGFKIVLTMIVELSIPLFPLWEQFTTIFLTGISIKKPPPPPVPGSQGGKKALCEWEFTTQYSQSSLFISESLHKGYQMIISKLGGG